MATEVGGDLIKDSVVFGYDTNYGVADSVTSTRFYPGQPTSNMVSSVQHGADQLLAVQSVTVAYVGEEDGWSKYSLNGSWTAGTYPYSIRVATAGPFLAGVKYSTQCKVKTNVPHKFTYFASNGLSYVNVAMDHNGVNSSTLLDDGSYLLKRQGFAYSTTTSQPGYLWSRGNSETFSSSTDFVYIKDFMVERNDHCTPWTATSRSDTASLIDLKETKSIDVSNTTFDSNAQMEFDGSNDMITVDVDALVRASEAVSIEGIVKATSINSAGPWAILTDHSTDSDKDGFWWHMNIGGYVYFRVEDATAGEQGTTFSGSVPFTANVYEHIVTVVGTSAVFIYLNGELVKSYTPNFRWNRIDSNQTAYLHIGRTYTNYYLPCEIPVFKLHNRKLTAAEVKEKYQSYKNRFNL